MVKCNVKLGKVKKRDVRVLEVFLEPEYYSFFTRYANHKHISVHRVVYDVIINFAKIHVGSMDEFFIEDELSGFPTRLQYRNLFPNRNVLEIQKYGHMHRLVILLDVKYCKVLVKYGQLYAKEDDTNLAAHDAVRDILKKFANMHMKFETDYSEQALKLKYKIYNESYQNHPN